MTTLRLRYRNPFSLLFSSAPWCAALYVVTSIPIAIAVFVLSVVLTVVGFGLSLTWVGLPLLLLALVTVQGLAAFERRRAGWVLGIDTTLPPRAMARGLRGQLTSRLRDPRTWREYVVLVALFPVLLVVDVIAFVLWLIPLALISLPFWYRYPPQTFDNGTSAHGVQLGYYPDGPQGTRRYGWFIDDLHSALLAAGAGVVLLALVGTYVVVGAARFRSLVTLSRVNG